MPVSITLPTTSVTAGPTYANQINTALTTLAAATHTGGANGDKWTAASLNIDGNVSWGGYSVTSLKATTYTQQTALATANSVWVDNSGNLRFTNGSGSSVQITSGGTLNTSALITSVYAQLALAANLVIASTDTYTQYLINTASARTITLPAASAVGAGRYYIFTDASGGASSNNVTINRAGSDTIDGATSYVIAENYGTVMLVSDGTSKWSIASGSAASRAIDSTFAFPASASSATIYHISKAGAGGAMAITAQSSTGAAGGAITVGGGTSSGGNGAGGAATFGGGNGQGTGTGGNVTIQSGTGGATGVGGVVDIKIGGNSAGSASRILRAYRDGGEYLCIGTGDPASAMYGAANDKPTVFFTNAGAKPSASLANAAGFALTAVSGGACFTLGGGDQVVLQNVNNAAVGGVNNKKLTLDVNGTTYYIALFTA